MDGIDSDVVYALMHTDRDSFDKAAESGDYSDVLLVDGENRASASHCETLKRVGPADVRAADHFRGQDLGDLEQLLIHDETVAALCRRYLGRDTETVADALPSMDAADRDELIEGLLVNADDVLDDLEGAE